MTRERDTRWFGGFPAPKNGLPGGVSGFVLSQRQATSKASIDIFVRFPLAPRLEGVHIQQVHSRQRHALFYKGLPTRILVMAEIPQQKLFGQESPVAVLVFFNKKETAQVAWFNSSHKKGKE